MLRFFAVGLVLLGALCPLVASAEQDAEAVKIIERAIKAMGGREKLAAKPAATYEDVGVYYGMGEGLDYQGKGATQGNDQMRMEILGVFTMVVNKDEGWTTGPNGTEKMSADQMAVQKEGLYGGWVATLVPLKDKSFSLKVSGRLEVDGKPTTGVTVSHKGKPDVQLYFDQKSGLLAKSEWKGKAEEFGDKEILKENFFSDYREVDGIQQAMKLKLIYDGKKYVESTVSNFEFHEKLDASMFAKPE